MTPPPNWLKIEVEKVIAGVNELARANSMVHARVATKINDRGELVIELILPGNYARAWKEPK
jgi:hypothetical protein